MNKGFLEFMTQEEEVPTALKVAIHKDITLSFRGRSILLKFLGFQLLGALFSMSVCPQFGLGLVEGHGLTHVFRMVGDWACALFCGSLFLSSGAAIAFVGMTTDELWWVWRRYKMALMMIFPSALWGALMLANITLELPGEIPSYHFWWLAAAVMIQFVFQLISKNLQVNKL
jgi:hypothetical protein